MAAQALTSGVALRNDLPLLDTRIPDLLMPLARFFSLFLGLIILGLTSGQGQTPAAAPAAERTKPVAAPGPRITFNSVHVDEPYIAMTFDDGPHGTLTPKLLDLLAARHMKVTFFVLGECIEQHPEVLQRAAREGHEIANHSWSHPQLNKMSDEAVRSQLRRTDDAIKQVTGKRPTLFRPPYGAITTRQKKWIHDEFGYQIIMWDVDPLDWKEPGPTTVSNRILRETRAGSIILSHDIHRGTIEAMPATFEQLQAKHFKFVTVSELIGLATPEPPKATPPARKSVAAPAATSSPAPDAAENAGAPAQSLVPAPAATTASSPGH